MNDKRTTSLFNGPVEVGLRALMVLREAAPTAYSVDRLVVLDYLLVHSDDLPGGPAGLHPRTPHRAGELLVRRGAVQAGLALYRSRGLVFESLGPEGVRFGASEAAAQFLDSLDSPYSKLLRDQAAWLYDRFGQVGDVHLQRLVEANLTVWGAEYTLESVLWLPAYVDELEATPT
jgi:hypothetical protein